MIDIQQLSHLYATLHPRSFTQQIKKQYPNLYKQILAYSLPVDVKTFNERVYVILNPMQPICQHPGCNVIINKITRSGWATHCSNKCKGQDNSLKSREKAKATSLENWGVDNPAKHADIRQKMKETLLANHGVEHALQSPIFQFKKTHTMLDLYGVEHASQSDEIQAKMVEKYLENWGVHNPAVRHITQDAKDKLNNPEWLREQNKTHSFLPIAESLGISTATLSKAFRKFEILPVRHNILVSEPEREIVEYIKTLVPGITINTSDRTLLDPYEVDIYLPEYNIAFEYNGLWFHSEEFGKDHKYHLYKTTKCAEKGIKLIHIWENDYLNNKNIIFSKIKHFLGKSSPIYARKCGIKNLTISEAKLFLNKTHIQGYCSSTIKLGLEINNEIVACMTLGKSRFTKAAEWELLRYSSKLEHNVIGGFSRLLKYFIKTYNPKSIISYSDRCWSTGEVYKTNGFKFLRSSKPSYFYTCDGKTIENRMSCQKKKLKTKLHTFDASLTEKDNMRNNGYYKIWNCGHDAWVLHL